LIKVHFIFTLITNSSSIVLARELPQYAVQLLYLLLSEGGDLLRVSVGLSIGCNLSASSSFGYPFVRLLFFRWFLWKLLCLRMPRRVADDCPTLFLGMSFAATLRANNSYSI